eukprot:snap_masked-scaffold_1-processed-gene-32.7-mRNA-1 protein AED:1.00 eAED:1.00 QI:0/-1/0/0/-1/1/1/0/324
MEYDACFVSGVEDGFISIKHSTSGQLLSNLTLDYVFINEIKIDKERERIFAATNTSIFLLTSFCQGFSSETTQKLKAHQGNCMNLEISNDSNWIATCGEDGVVKIFDVRQSLSEVVQQYKPRLALNSKLPSLQSFPYNNVLHSICLDEDQVSIYAIGAMASVFHFDLRKMEQVNSASNFLNSVRRQSRTRFFNARIWKEEILIGTSHGSVISLDKHDLRLLTRRQIHKEAVLDLNINSPKCTIASCSADKSVHLSSLNDSEVSELQKDVHEQFVNKVRFTTDGDFVFTACSDGRVRVFNTSSGNLVKQFVCKDEKPVTAIAILD